MVNLTNQIVVNGNGDVSWYHNSYIKFHDKKLRFKQMRIYTIEQVMEITTLRKTSIYSEIKAGRFPRPKKLTDRRVGWWHDDIETWMKKRESSDLKV